MEKEFIAIELVCRHYEVENNFLESLQQAGLLEIEIVDQQPCIPATQLQLIERLIRMHYELHINLEGIDAISHLLNRVTDMQHEIFRLRNRLHLYENIHTHSGQ